MDILGGAVVPRELGHGGSIDARLYRLLNRRNKLFNGGVSVTGEDLRRIRLRLGTGSSAVA